MCLCPGVCEGSGTLHQQSRVERTPEASQGIRAAAETGLQASKNVLQHVKGFKHAFIRLWS